MMGLFKAIALLPLAPVQGVVWVAERIQEQVDREMLDPEVIIAELGRWQAELDEGLITEEEYLLAEDELLDRLEMLQEHR